VPPGHRLCRPRIGDSGDGVDDDVALVQDGNLKPVSAPLATSSSIVACTCR
jgi:hypothetical protein